MMTRTAPTIPDSAVGRKVYYLPPDGRKVTAVVESVDHKIHPSRLVLRITATKDRHYRKGLLVSTPPAFVQVR